MARRPRYPALVLLGLSCFVAASAPAARWQPVGPAGGPTTALAAAGLEAYAATPSGLATSHDGGATWSVAVAAPARPNVVAQDPADGRRVWVAALAAERDDFTFGGVFESRDGGDTWLDRSAGLVDAQGVAVAVYGLAFAGRAPLAATSDGVRAWDGRRWERRGLDGTSVVGIAADPHDPRLLLAGAYAPFDASTGIYRSADGGAAWERVAERTTAFVLRFDPTRAARAYALDGGVLRSDDGGVTWTRQQRRSDTTGLEIGAGGAVLVTTTHGLLRSTDGGATLSRAALAGEPLTAVVVARGTVLVSGERGVWRAADAVPLRLRPSSSGYTSHTIGGLAWDGDGTVLVGSQGIPRSRDLGGHWTIAPTSPGGAPLLAAAPSAPGTLYAVGFDDAGIRRTRDGGATWESPGPAVNASDANGITVDPNDAAVVYVAESERTNTDLTSCTLKSTDGGATFACLHAAGADNFGARLFANAIAVRPGDSAFVLAVNGGLVRSRDGGATWTFLRPVPPDVEVLGAVFDAADPRRILLGTTAGVVVSRDDAASFSPSSSGLPAHAEVVSLVANRSVPGEIFAGVRRADPARGRAPGEVYRSDDGGRTWRRLGPRLPREFTGRLALDEVHRVLYAATAGRGLFRFDLEAAAERVTRDPAARGVQYDFARGSMRSLLLRSGLVVASLGVALVGAEAVLRLRALPPEDAGSAESQLERSARTPLAAAGGRFTLLGLVRPSPVPEIIYELKPDQQGVFKGRPVRVNHLGMRGAETTVVKPPGTVRIAGLGDSVMFGWGVGEGEPYLQLVEKAINDEAPQGTRYELLNFAVPGYNTVMEVATFEHKVLAFAPDLVVMHFIGNDLSLPHFLAPPAPPGRGFHSVLLDTLRARFRDAPDPESAALEVPELVHAAAELPAAMRGETINRYAAWTGRGPYDRAMTRFAALAREHGIPVLVMRLGEGGEDGDDVAGEAARRLGLRAFNAAPVFWSYLQANGLGDAHDVWVRTFKIPNDGHPNALGHRMYADGLLGELRAMGLGARR